MNKRITSHDIELVSVNFKTDILVDLEYPIIISSNNYKMFSEIYSAEELKERGYSYQHVYVTSDEKIEKGDWYLQPVANMDGERVFEEKGEDGYEEWNESHFCKKIIMTTDTRIKNADQLDEEFVEEYIANIVDTILVENTRKIVSKKSMENNYAENFKSLSKDIDSYLEIIEDKLSEIKKHKQN